MNGVSRVVELENILSEIMDEWDQEELVPAEASSLVNREDIESDLCDLMDRARTILARDEEGDRDEF